MPTPGTFGCAGRWQSCFRGEGWTRDRRRRETPSFATSVATYMPASSHSREIIAALAFPNLLRFDCQRLRTPDGHAREAKRPNAWMFFHVNLG